MQFTSSALKAIYFGYYMDEEIKTLYDAFSGKRSVIYPPNAADDKLKILHQLGYSGPMWDFLLAAKGGRSRGARKPAPESGE